MRKLLVVLGLAMAAVKVAAAMLVLPLQQAVTSGAGVGALITYAGAVATSALLGVVKKTDTTVTNSAVFRKLQPFITLGGAFLAPWAATHLGATVDPAVFAQAPLASLVTIGGAELLSLLQRKTGR